MKLRSRIRIVFMLFSLALSGLAPIHGHAVPFPIQAWATAVNLQAAWNTTTGDARAVIAVLDTGVDATVPGLRNHVLPGYDAISGGTDTTDRAPNRHGTTVALIAAGRGTINDGGAGVAWGAQILPVRCLDADGTGTSGTLAAGVRWAVDHGATVINMSTTASIAPFAPDLSRELAYAGAHHVPVVVASGEGRDAITYPANDATVITVGATDTTGNVADFSPRRVKTDVLAPGVQVVVAAANGQAGVSTSGTGTSFSSAIVAGTVALMQSVRPDLRPEDIRDILFHTARPVASSIVGQLDAGNAVRAVLALPASLAVVPPPAYHTVYDRNDSPVQSGAVSRGYTWGPDIRANLYEPYSESPNGQRHVWYFDKGRLEQNDPAGGEITSGLLVTEMVTGRLQLGRDQFMPRDAATVPVVGDVSVQPSGLTAQSVSYATLAAVRQLPPRASGAPITELLAPNGERSVAQQTATYRVTATSTIPETRHAIASVFADYLNSMGIVQASSGRGVSGVTTAPLFAPQYAIVGLPITEAYWVTAIVGGKTKTVLLQAFERRVLTYTPDNPGGFQVEMGNVGLQYLAWRYG